MKPPWKPDGCFRRRSSISWRVGDVEPTADCSSNSLVCLVCDRRRRLTMKTPAAPRRRNRRTPTAARKAIRRPSITSASTVDRTADSPPAAVSTSSCGGTGEAMVGTVEEPTVDRRCCCCLWTGMMKCDRTVLDPSTGGRRIDTGCGPVALSTSSS